MSDIEDFLMSHIEPILKRALSISPAPEKSKSQDETQNSNEMLIKKYKLSKEMLIYKKMCDQMNYNEFEPILFKCDDCPFRLSERACETFRKTLGPKYVCEKYYNKKFEHDSE